MNNERTKIAFISLSAEKNGVMPADAAYTIHDALLASARELAGYRGMDAHCSSAVGDDRGNIARLTGGYHFTNETDLKTVFACVRAEIEKMLVPRITPPNIRETDDGLDITLRQQGSLRTTVVVSL